MSPESWNASAILVLRGLDLCSHRRSATVHPSGSEPSLVMVILSGYTLISTGHPENRSLCTQALVTASCTALTG